MKPILYIPNRHQAYTGFHGPIDNTPRLAATLATPATVAPLSEAEENLLNTNFEDWPVRKSFNDSVCGCCGHIECIND